MNSKHSITNKRVYQYDITRGDIACIHNDVLPSCLSGSCRTLQARGRGLEPESVSRSSLSPPLGRSARHRARENVDSCYLAVAPNEAVHSTDTQRMRDVAKKGRGLATRD